MSLYFEERVKEEQAVADSEKAKVTFSLRMIGVILPPTSETFNHYRLISLHDSFRTTYANHTFKWDFSLSKEGFAFNVAQRFDHFLSAIISHLSYPFWKGSCNFTYKLYSNDETPVVIYSSPRMSAPPTHSSSFFQTPKGSMKEFTDAFDERKVGAVFIYIQLELPTKMFIRPFDHPWFDFDRNICDDYPENIESDFRFEFLKESDFTIKCPDGNVPALKMVLNVANSFWKEQLKQSNGNELIVDHSVDVIKPLITYIHSRCFEMPEIFDVDYADRLLKAVKFFELEDEIEKGPIWFTVYYSLCEKFVEGFPDFESILQLLSLASRHSFNCLINMSAAEIAIKYYYKWHQTSSDDEINVLTRLLFDSIILESELVWISKEIEEIFIWSLLIKVILP